MNDRQERDQAQGQTAEDKNDWVWDFELVRQDHEDRDEHEQEHDGFGVMHGLGTVACLTSKSIHAIYRTGVGANTFEAFAVGSHDHASSEKGCYLQPERNIPKGRFGRGWMIKVDDSTSLIFCLENLVTACTLPLCASFSARERQTCRLHSRTWLTGRRGYG